eukprot:CAMPEP_0172643030 /NCGR_PEP_ID=MMETSP1068-20121228/234894_1 /TAXON_ID=35684 /ORGANISM="Pseudopedinella elastica, Strain CCMP716" /LENGTH=469 /DNA_ID=CAMNT_0013456971 /DNA_START=152 /DNA_END=1561 /DNA_ORIENTATION=+
MPMTTRRQVENAQFARWYPNFRDVSIRSEIVPLPEHFINWLKADGVSLPTSTPTTIFCGQGSADDVGSDDDSSWASDEGAKEGKDTSDLSVEQAVDGGDSKPADAKPHKFDFAELDEAVNRAISALGGSVFPKLNWSSPQDASWMNMGNLKCRSPGDIYLLLKSSDFVSHDIHFPFDACCLDENLSLEASLKGGSGAKGSVPREQEASENLATVTAPPTNNPVTYTLVLRKWCELRPERGFRCFVRGKELVGISQRDCTAHFPQLEADRETIHDTIENFLNRPRAKTGGDCSSGGCGGSDKNGSERLLDRLFDNKCVVDVYVNVKFKCWVVDINAWGQGTDSLLYDWNELFLSGQEGNTARAATETGSAQCLLPPAVSTAPSGGAGNEATGPTTVASSLARRCDLRLVAKDQALRAGRFSDYKAPIEMHLFAQSLGGGGAADETGAAESLMDFKKIMEEVERAAANQRE